ncbi:Sec-independent protein translocase protein TatB [Rhodopseudomonas sp. HC1]|uniref:Sec-independent protein translocase protein TatB n=1 Tax=Rhodopseudomonas infernalis TaxID=2897386 RepID=UPI001EE99D88|nr:Sec-independent protein translocase protein TatB [Rhodopseudomonas infernalis]MCG6205909.1 Sec-independent protein translocase protein TatB [Rhodopseudomonas infernalis]
MFDIGWSELVVIGVVALIAIGPKELPGVLRMVGQWMGKARKLATEFQGQFQEAMREAEMADLKKSFDEVREATSGLATNNMLTKLGSEISEAAAIDKKDTIDTPPVEPTTPVPPTPETFIEATTHQAVTSEPLAIVSEAHTSGAEHLPVPAETHALATQDMAPPDLSHPAPPTPAEPVKDAKAS